MTFSTEVLEAAAREREIQLTTYGRRSGNPHRTTMWIWGDGERLFVTSAMGLSRDWPQNLVARGRGVLHVGGLDVPVVARHLTGPGEARSVHPLIERKYGVSVPGPKQGDGPAPAEEATFELRPAPDPG